MQPERPRAAAGTRREHGLVSGRQALLEVFKLNKHGKLLALILALVLAVSLAACGGKDPEPTESSAPEVSEAGEKYFINTLADTIEVGGFPKYTEKVKEYYERNADTVGWLDIPGNAMSDVVVCKQDPADENNFYYRRDFNGNKSQAGVFYADFRSRFGEGSAGELPRNTVIYGHSLSADWDGVMFAPLKYFTDEEFAKKTPYIFFSTAKEDMVFEVFSVMYATVNLPYNNPNPTDAEFSDLINECVKRSLYTYDVEVTANDKIISLSTCTYSIPGKGTVPYPSDYRYVVMAKLVEKSEATKTEAAFEVNPAPKEP